MITTSRHEDGPVDAANGVAHVVVAAAVADDEAAAVVVGSAKPVDVEYNCLPAQLQRHVNVDDALGSNVKCRNCRSTECYRVRQYYNM